MRALFRQLAAQSPLSLATIGDPTDRAHVETRTTAAGTDPAGHAPRV